MGEICITYIEARGRVVVLAEGWMGARNEVLHDERKLLLLTVPMTKARKPSLDIDMHYLNACIYHLLTINIGLRNNCSISDLEIIALYQT